MAFGNFPVGNYAATFDGTSIGLTKTGETFLVPEHKGEDIDDVDLYGNTIVDDIGLGTNYSLVLIMKEWNAQLRKMIFPYGNPASPEMDGKLGKCGMLGSDIAKQLVLTAQAGTTASTIGPALLTFAKTKISLNNDFRLLFGNRSRNIPLRLRILPYDDSGTIRHFTITQTGS